MNDVEAVISAQHVDDLWQFLSNWLSEFGFTRIIYGNTRFNSMNSFGDPSDFMILTTLPSDYVRQFIEDRLFFSGPMLLWAKDNVGAKSWSLMAEMLDGKELSSSERKVLELNQKFNLTAGYTLSFGGASKRHKAAMGLATESDKDQDYVDALWSEHGRKILAFCNVAHLKLMDLPFSSKDRNMTSRQREVLEWVGEGKTTQDIAQILELTPATVEKHLRRAREVLNVDTTAQAVLKASLHNQIYIKNK
ncbi:hypothetical protein GCM10011517_07900 [Actibacterium pelagium]|uniref:HTH luxR-type domain-containing protein n=1 Tax=Actibacterium pelagium TaxID=2029103 RepID=A0A917EHH8_9RHOB|nr:hypothetical protein GCM10011517_07900 [Actibacterium pelagium]